jgi:hypothetical protein
MRAEARLLVRNDAQLNGRQEPSAADSMQEKKGVPRPDVEGPRGRGAARRSPAQAAERRSEIDRSGGLGKPRIAML